MNTIENETEENTEAITTARAITANISRVNHNITVGARFPRPYNVVNSIENCCKIQEQINQHLKQLSLERLQVVADFVAYLADKESEEATQELLEIPGFVESFARGNMDISEGRITPLEQLKRKY